MTFDVKNKVAIVTGGAGGLGLSIVKEILKNGGKGVTIADVNKNLGEQAIRGIEEEFGRDVAIFVPTDISKKEQFENVFKKTIEAFGNIDILVNNAGVFKDNLWQEEVTVNVVGTLHGIILAFHSYLQEHKQGSEALIVNISSIGALQPVPHIPVYGGTKMAVLAFTRNWGNPEIYNRTNVRVVAICPGGTDTPGVQEITNTMSAHFMPGIYTDIKMARKATSVVQKPEVAAKEAIRVMKHAPNGTIWVIESSQPAYQYILPDRSTMRNNVLEEN